MSGRDVLVVAEHLDGTIADATFELLGKARELSAAGGGQAVVALLGAPDLAGQLGGADRVITVDDPALTGYTSEAWETALSAVIDAVSPRLVLLSTATTGLDLAGSLSIRTGMPLVSYVVELAAEGDTIVATSQLYGGKLLAEVAVDGGRAVCAVTAGAFPAAAGHGEGAAVEAMDPPTGIGDLRTTFLQLLAPDAGDVDITAADVLVSVGRGIGSQDNLELLEELADALGAPLSASRPVTDQGWLPKTRQVGKSGLKVKPRVYLAFGISGAPEHLEGMRDAELIIACNTDEQAPIFDVAHFGTTVDLFDLVPALAEKLG